MENGLPSKFLINLSDKQVDNLYKKYLSEQPQTKGTLKVPAGSQAEKDAQAKKIPYMTYEEEMKETEEDPMDFEKGARSQDAKQVGPASDDGFGNYDDGTGEFTEGKKKSKYNPWAVCTSQMGKEFGTTERSDWSKPQMAKYERCVKDVKKSIKEGRNPYESLLENQIMRLVNKHVNENMNMVSFKKLDKPIGKMYSSKKSSPMEAAEPAVKPRTAPPKTKPGVKPSKPNPYQPPKETPKEKPRAQDYKSMFISALNQLLGK